MSGKHSNYLRSIRGHNSQSLYNYYLTISYYFQKCLEYIRVNPRETYMTIWILTSKTLASPIIPPVVKKTIYIYISYTVCHFHTLPLLKMQIHVARFHDTSDRGILLSFSSPAPPSSFCLASRHMYPNNRSYLFISRIFIDRL